MSLPNEAQDFAVRVRSEGASPALLEALAARAAVAAREGLVLAEPLEARGECVWLKGAHLPGKARVRHSLAALVGRPAPREREFTALRWMRARLFRVPDPLAAITLRRAGLVRYQLLALRPLGPHETLADAWEAGAQAERESWSDELARETARLHALHRVHRNLFLRNVLVDRAPAQGDPRRLIWIDAWRSGAPLPGRDEAYDLGALMVDGAMCWSVDEQRRFFAGYFDAREQLGRRGNAKEMLQRAATHHARLAARAGRAPTWAWREALSTRAL